MDHIDHTFGNPCLFQEINEDICGTRYLLRWLNYICISQSNCQREHPERNHCWEIEWADTCADTERSSIGIDVDVSSNVLDGLPHGQRVETSSMFDNFITSEHVTSCICQRFAMFAGYDLSNIASILL